jgi:hypothetical protein
MQRINAKEREFEHDVYTYPCSAFTVSVGCRGDWVAVFWISPGHVGGRSPLEGERFLQPITEGEWRQTAGILGIPTDYDPASRPVGPPPGRASPHAPLTAAARDRLQ